MRKNKKLCILFLLCMAGLFVLGGCDSKSASSAEQAAGEAGQEEEAENLGEFSMEDIKGNTFTQEMFSDYDLTMMNVFATWCTPCVREIPDLEKLGNDMADQGVNVVGVVLDAVTDTGSVDEAAVENAKLLAEKSGATYPFLIPDAGYLNGRLSGISAVPETFFVDSEGNIVGETYIGSHELEEWKEILKEELEGARK